jgi:hypothetical protein
MGFSEYSAAREYLEIIAVMIVVQGFVLIKAIKKDETLRFEKEGYAGRLGSSLLHLGLVVLIFNFMTIWEVHFTF